MHIHKSTYQTGLPRMMSLPPPKQSYVAFKALAVTRDRNRIVRQTAGPSQMTSCCRQRLPEQGDTVLIQIGRPFVLK